MKYQTIIADPPWAYPEGHVRTAATGRGHQFADGVGRDYKRSLPYDGMSVEAIATLPVEQMAHGECRLFLWTTNRYLPASFEVVKRWGFAYRQTLIWHKTEAAPFPAHLAPNTAEFLIVAVRGHPSRLATLPSSVIKIGARKVHSEKPDAFLDMIEQVSPGPYLELFARRARFGWDYWGDESLGTAEMPEAVA